MLTRHKRLAYHHTGLAPEPDPRGVKFLRQCLFAQPDERHTHNVCVCVCVCVYVCVCIYTYVYIYMSVRTA
jgi:hypothetical protein